MALVEWKSRIIIRNDILANWESVNPVLSKGELSVVIGPKPQLKVGDGTNHWKDLPYINDLSNYYTKEEINGLITQLENYYSKEEINALISNYYTKTEVDSKFLTEEQVDAHINKIITDAVDGDTLTNLTELVKYINSHDTDIITDVANIEKQLSGIGSDEGAVKAYIDNSISSLNINNYATVESLTALEKVVATKANQADLTALAAIVNGDENTEGTIKNQIKAVKDEIPTTEEIEALITGHGYTTSAQVETLINNHGFITTTEVNTKLEDYATKTWVNTELEDYVSVDDEVVLNGGAA